MKYGLTLLFGLTICAVSGQGQDRVKRVFGFDPVILVRTGESVSGKADLEVSRYEFTYLFSSTESKAEFIRNPKKYEFQFGGACGRMGPLSGIGNPNHFLVKGGKLYSFASAPCKQTFEKHSEKLLEFDDPKPKVMRASIVEGKKLAERVLAAHGGRNTILNLGAFEMIHLGSHVAGNRTYKFESRYAFHLANGMYADGETWDDYQYGNATNGKKSCFVSKHKWDFEMHPEQVRSLTRKRGQHFVSVLWAIAKRRAHVFSSFDSPATLNVWHEGVATKLETSAEGKVLAQEFTGRGPNSFMGLARREFSEWQSHNGASLPIRWQEFFDGKPTSIGTSYTIKPLLDLIVFSPQK